jgi:hypothetical protein
MLMLARAETYEQRAEEAPTLGNAHTPACNVGQGRRMRCYKRAPCSLSSCFMHANRYLPPRCVHPPGDLSVGSGRRCCFIGKAHQTFGFCSSGSSVSVVCRCWAASSMARCAARRPLSSRYQFSSHASSAIITALQCAAPHILGSEQQILSVFSRAVWPGSSRRACCKVCFSCHLSHLGLERASRPSVRHSRAPP